MTAEPTVVAIAGAGGRMGRALVRAILADPGLRLGSALVRPGSDDLGRDAGELAGVGRCGIITGTELEAGQVLVDFSSAQALPRWLAACRARGIAFLSGTTALDAGAEDALEAAAEQIPVMWAPNLSVGAQLLASAAESVARALGPEADIEIIETHHRHMKDAPSGTALALGERLARARGSDLQTVGRLGRQGRELTRPTGEIGIAAVRAGDVVGEHTVLIALPGERLEFTHRAATRDAFVAGALRAARWLAGKPPGRYQLGQVLE